VHWGVSGDWKMRVVRLGQARADGDIIRGSYSCVARKQAWSNGWIVLLGSVRLVYREFDTRNTPPLISHGFTSTGAHRDSDGLLIRGTRMLLPC
jgi:hypothetical protein